MPTMWRRAQVVVACAASAAIVAGGLIQSLTRGNLHGNRNTLALLVELVIAAGGAVLVVVGTWWWWRRPYNLSGALMVALAGAAGLLQLSYWTGGLVADTLLLPAQTALRPLTCWVLLAWPAGMLRRRDRPWLVAFTVAHVGLAGLATVAANGSVDGPYAWFDVPSLTAALNHLNYLVLIEVAAATVFVALARRTRVLPATARRLYGPVAAAAACVAVADCVAVPMQALAGDALSSGSGLTPFGFTMAAIDLGRFLAVGVGLGVSARRVAALGQRVAAARSVELGPRGIAPPLASLLRARTGDPGVRVVYRSGSGWVDAAGSAVDLHQIEGRTVTIIERDGLPAAALELDCELDGHPSIVEAAAAAVSATLEHERLQAVALARLEEVRRARLAIVEAEDAARRRVARDLHDGAQQRLLGLALQARLAGAAHHTDDAGELSRQVASARAELHDLVDGVLPGVLAEHGLPAALGTMAATMPLGVTIDVDLPPDLEPVVVRTTWFVVSEAVANAVKHASARHVSIAAHVLDGHLAVVVRDDGVGGATLDNGGGLRGLQDRVGHAGGTAELISELGEGTTLRVVLPVAPALSGVA